MAKENTKNLRTVDNAAAYQIVNAAYKQAVGENAVDTLTLDDFTDSGVAYASLTMGRDKFFNALIDQVVNFYNEESYKSEYNDPFYVESRRFANIIQMINAQAPEVQASHAWRDLKPTVDGQGNITYATVGSYEVKQATISTRYFAKSNSWELSISLTEEQLSDAFKSADELRGFVDYLFLIVDNALTLHKETNMMANVSSFIGNKILYSQSQGATGIHVVNLLTKYNAERGGTLATVADFLADADALRFASAQLMLFSDYMKKQSKLFNIEGLVKFCPANRLVAMVNTAFESALQEVALSTTFNDNFVALPNHVSVPYWQGFGIEAAATESDPATHPAAFDQVTKIDVSTDMGDVSKSGIVALLADKYACMHTIRQERVASQYFPMEDLTMYAYQNRDQYINNLAQNAVVFTIEAPST